MPFQETNPEFEKLVAQALAAGLIQSEISQHFKKQGIKPNSLSIIEKKIKQMKEDHKANTLFHLAVILRKTPIQELINTLELDIKSINEFDSKEDKYYRQGLKYALNLANDKLLKEKDELKKAYVSGLKHEFGCLEPNEYYNKNFNK
jgi:uncharacterized protein (DUF2164 family)